MKPTQQTTSGPVQKYRDRGATAVEYSFIVALIAAIIVLTVQAVGIDTLDFWGRIDW